MKILMSMSLALFSILGASPSMAEPLSADQKARMEARFPAIEKLAADGAIVQLVQEYNAKKPPELSAMTQDQWKTLKIIDLPIKILLKNTAADALREFRKSDAAMSEAFVSAADGTKVALSAKSSNWSHKGKPKHDEPMAGKRWIGTIEVDDSTGVKQVQASVPVLVNGKPVGSLVVAFQAQKL